MTGLLYFLFFCSGFSGLIYQVAWVRVFGNVFGNTIYSASLVVAVFMLGLGVGSYVVGAWADRRYVERPDSLLRVYAHVEFAVAALGLAVSALLPHLEQLSALVSSYSQDAQGWYALSAGSHLARAAIAVILLAPITILMGGTLTLLIRHLVRADVDIGAWRIAVLYSVNTAGAALGCLLTDLAFVPAYGLLNTQFIAVTFNVVAGLGALYLAFRLPAFALSATARSRRSLGGGGKPEATASRKAQGSKHRAQAPATLPKPGARSPEPEAARLIPVALALALSGFAAMGMEIVWFRHFSILLGEFRAVFSLLLGIILLGISGGSFAGGFLHRRTTQPALWLIGVQGLFIAATLLGLASADAQAVRDAGLAHAAALAATGREVSGWERAFEELWFNAMPMLVEVAVPALLMGFAFPLGNAVIQRTERSVGRRAGLLYLANTAGAVCGSLASGFLLLPALGIQASATILMLAAGAAVVPLHLASRGLALDERSPSRTIPGRRRRAPVGATVGSLAVTAVALGLWLRLPSDYMIARALVLPVQPLLTVSEGITEVIAVADVPGRGRMLLTNGHPMSSTDPLSQRYMRALAHIPLLSVDNPEDVLVMCFGVGNTAHAATLHPSVRRVEVVDLSGHVLSHAGYFSDVNGNVLQDRRVVVHVNDGRHHLRMRREAAYDLITLEPPPIVHAGVGALYSREFYALARTRLKPKGSISQWLPVSQVPAETTLAMIRAFVDVFPQSVLLSGADTNLLLVGVNDWRIEVDPARIAAALSTAPGVQADLRRLDLGDAREIVGTFVASARTLADATRDTPPATDDRPIQEYSARSLLTFGGAPPASIVDLSQVSAWCPGCFVNGRPVPLVEGLDTYLSVLELAYRPSPGATAPTPAPADGRPRMIAGSAYLGTVVPESAELHTLLGRALDAPDEALPHLRRSVELNPRDGEARYHLATVLLESRQYDDAIEEFRAALRLMPDSVEARNNLGVTLASQGRLDEAIDEFRLALKLRPDFADARRNLTMALEKRAQR
ncbi:MAG TPA: tetratricopeptide repeat protein, partial [Vicinamibacterales bacterium]